MDITIPNPERLDPRLQKHFDRVRRGRRRSHRFRVEKRASSFPVCPRKYHIYRRLPPSRRPYEEDTFISNAATLQGTALHLVLQKWFGIEMDKHAYGNWECERCGKIKRHALGIQICPQCKEEAIYKEYEIERTADVPFTGHLDLILWFKDIRFLLDFKGSSMDKLQAMQRTGRPKYEHYLQTNGYAEAINLGGQNVGKLSGIDKIIILYVDRGRPWWTQAWWAVQMPVSKRVYRETTSLIYKAERSLETMEIPLGLCPARKSSRAKWCEAAELCFSPLLETQLDDTVYPEDARPQDRRLENQLEKRGNDDESVRG